jgi:hypothetical protein
MLKKAGIPAKVVYVASERISDVEERKRLDLLLGSIILL